MAMLSLFLRMDIASFMKMRFCVLGILVFLAASLCGAQEPIPPEKPDDHSKEGYTTYDLLQSGIQDEGEPQEPIPVPIQAGEETVSLGDQTFLDDVFQDPQNRWGFSLGAYGAYTSDIGDISPQNRDSGIFAFMPRTFFNFGREKSRFHIDVGAGYRYYTRDKELNNWDYYGAAHYSYQVSKRTSFQLYDQFTSSYNDAWSFLSLYSPHRYDTGSSNEVLFNRQRINRNSARAQVDHQATSKLSLSAFGGYRMFRYPQSSLRDSDLLEAGAGAYYQLFKWLYVTGTFSTYINLFEGSGREAKIYRLQFAGLDFHLSDSWRIWATGGVDYSDYEEGNRWHESISSGIGYTSQNTSFSLTYQRGFTSAIGLSRLLVSDIWAASYGYRMTGWMATRVESYYYRSMETDGGLLKTFSGGGGFDFALRRDLTMTTRAYYQNQHSEDFSIGGLELNRFTAYIGLQYMWPSRKDR